MWFESLLCPWASRSTAPSWASPSAMLPLLPYSFPGPNSFRTLGGEKVLPPSVESETAGQLSLP